MIHRATEELAYHFDGNGIAYDLEETENASLLRLSVALDLNKIDILFISTDEEADVAVRVFDLAAFPAARLDAVLHAANALNRAYRFVAFSVDEEKDTVDVRADLPVNTEDVGAAGYEMFLRMTSICNEAYPQLMRAVWGE